MVPCDGLECFVPRDPAGWWAAIGAVFTLVGALGTVAVAVMAVIISRRQLFLEATPIVILRRSGGTTIAENVGRGVALTLTACDHNGGIADEFGSLRAGEERPIRLTPSITTSNALYYQSTTSQWFRSKVTGRSISGDEKQYPVDTAFQRTSYRRLPKSVRLRMRRHARSAYEHAEQLSSFVTVEGWRNRLDVRRKRMRRIVENNYYSIGESSRIAEFSTYSLQANRAAHFPIEVREQWEFDLQGIANCWHSAGLDIDHFGCFDLVNGSVVCEVAINYIGGPRVDGLVVVEPATRASMLKLVQSARSDIVWEKLSAYVCGRLPKQRFVVRV